MLKQKNFISNDYVSIDGETGKDTYEYFRLELNELNFVATNVLAYSSKGLKFVVEVFFFCFVTLC